MPRRFFNFPTEYHKPGQVPGLCCDTTATLAFFTWESNHFSYSSLIGIGGTSLSVGGGVNNVFRYMPRTTFSDLRGIVKTGKILRFAGTGIGYLGIFAKGYEAFEDGKISLGEGVSIGISVISIYFPVIGIADLGVEMITGTSISDRIAYGIDSAYPTANFSLTK